MLSSAPPISKEVHRAPQDHPQVRPRHPEGNATKHGLFSSQVVLQHEDVAEFEALRQNDFAELAPEGFFFKEIYAGEVVVGLWRLWRAIEVRPPTWTGFEGLLGGNGIRATTFVL